MACVFALVLSACGEEESATDKLGAPCSTSSDCADNQTCAPVGLGSGAQCTAFCSSSEECSDAFGWRSYCIGANDCVKECYQDEDCPPGTFCNSNDWCDLGSSF